MTVSPIAGSLDTTTSQIFQRNAYARLNYAPSSNWSAFLGGHLFGDSRNPGTPLSYANRDQRDVSLGVNYGTTPMACSACARGTAVRSSSSGPPRSARR